MGDLQDEGGLRPSDFHHYDGQDEIGALEAKYLMGGALPFGHCKDWVLEESYKNFIKCFPESHVDLPHDGTDTSAVETNSAAEVMETHDANRCGYKQVQKSTSWCLKVQIGISEVHTGAAQIMKNAGCQQMRITCQEKRQAGGHT